MLYRFLSDSNKKEYYIEDWNDWYTKDEIKEQLKELNYWTNDFPGECEDNDDNDEW